MSKVVQVLGTGATAPRSGLGWGLGFATAAAHGTGLVTAAVTVGGLGFTTAAVVVPRAGVAPVITVLHGGLCASALHNAGQQQGRFGSDGFSLILSSQMYPPLHQCDQAGTCPGELP